MARTVITKRMRAWLEEGRSHPERLLERAPAQVKRPHIYSATKNGLIEKVDLVIDSGPPKDNRGRAWHRFRLTQKGIDELDGKHDDDFPFF